MATTEEAGPSKNNDDEKEKEKDESMFECNICLDTARDAVVSFCGHLFCWPCLHQWLETRPTRQVCPVCKAAIGKDKVVPLYGRGNTKQEDPRTKVPPRPAGQRSEPENNGGFPGFPFGDGSFHMSFGIGAFPFGFFTSTFNMGDHRLGAARHRMAQQSEEQELVSKVFLLVACVFIFWLIFT